MKYTVSNEMEDSEKSPEDGQEESAKKISNPGIGVRHLQSLLLALCILCGYLQRVNLSVTIVAMTTHNGTDTSSFRFPVYHWSSEERGYLHSAFFIGYLIMNFPASVLGVHFNNKRLLIMTFFTSGLLVCATPFIITHKYTGSIVLLQTISDWAGEGNWKLLVIVRVVQGLLQAFMLPTLHAISARWAPPHERSRLVGFILSGVPFGTMITLAGSGILASIPWLGWPSVFYASGGAAFLWISLFMWLGANSPSSHPTISTEEYLYIKSSLPPQNAKSETNVPWKELLTSTHTWAIIIAHATHNWGYWLLLSEMPTFMNAVLGYNIKKDGLFSALPYLGMWLCQFPVMYVADCFNKRGITSITASRKIWNTIGQGGAAVGLIVLGYLDGNASAILIMYILVMSISCCCNVGFNINHIDLSPNYAGILMGLSNAFAATGGLGSPFIVSFLVHDIHSVTEWRNVFYVGAAILFFGNLFFVIFGSGKTQKWNNKYTQPL